MKKKLLFSLFLSFFFSTFTLKTAQALQCDGRNGTPPGLTGRIVDNAVPTPNPIINAIIIVYVDNDPPDGIIDSQRNLGSRDDGGFTYGWPVKGNLFLLAAKNGYQPMTGPIPLTQCLDSVIVLEADSSPPPPPGTNPRCAGSCADATQCQGASDGCSLCFGGMCVNPAWAPPTPTPAPLPCGVLKRIPTALGCVPTDDINLFVGWLLKISLGIGGGIAFLLMLWGVFKIMTGGDNPENIQAGKELITAALTGLIMIILSLYFLKFIGVEILELPWLGS